MFQLLLLLLALVNIINDSIRALGQAGPTDGRNRSITHRGHHVTGNRLSDYTRNTVPYTDTRSPQLEEKVSNSAYCFQF